MTEHLRTLLTGSAFSTRCSEMSSDCCSYDIHYINMHCYDVGAHKHRTRIVRSQAFDSDRRHMAFYKCDVHGRGALAYPLQSSLLLRPPVLPVMAYLGPKCTARQNYIRRCSCALNLHPAARA